MSEILRGYAAGITVSFSESCKELAKVLCNPGGYVAKKNAQVITSFTATMSDQGATNPLFNKQLEEMMRESLPVVEDKSSLTQEQKEGATPLETPEQEEGATPEQEEGVTPLQTPEQNQDEEAEENMFSVGEWVEVQQNGTTVAKATFCYAREGMASLIMKMTVNDQAVSGVQLDQPFSWKLAEVKKLTPRTTQAEPGPRTTQAKPGPRTTQAKPGPRTTQAKPGPRTTQAKPGPRTTQPEPGPRTTQAKPGPKTTQAKPGPRTTQAKPGPRTTQAKPGPRTTQAKPGPRTTQAKPGPRTTQAKPGPMMNTQAKPGPRMKTQAKPGPRMKTQAKPGPRMKTQAKPGPKTKTQAKYWKYVPERNIQPPAKAFKASTGKRIPIKKKLTFE
ncbi:hypothetical protein Bbelb_018200 [Branchiostoma belcheri]|nr:hypothetical protein Bbelb_018200 [Branchiostoma belcheri]